LELTWAVLIDQILSEIEHNNSPSCHRSSASLARILKALDLLLEYFNNDEQCLPKDSLKTDKYKVLTHALF